jgi:DNA-binding transcriptional MerR regulator
MRVAQLARELSISPDTIRYYTLIGLLHPLRNTANNYKEYREQDRSRLQFIISARKLGFTLDDIKEIIHESNKGRTGCPSVPQLLEKRLQETEQSFSQQSALRNHIKKAMKYWKNRPNQEPTGHEICHLIESFSFDE